jgi:hypothetical protein
MGPKHVEALGLGQRNCEYGVAIWGGGLTLNATGVTAFGLICRLSARVAFAAAGTGGVSR